MLLSRVQAAEDVAGGIDWACRSTRRQCEPTSTLRVRGLLRPPFSKEAERGTQQVDPVLRKVAVRLEEIGQIGDCLGRRVHHQVPPVAEGRCRPFGFVLTPGTNDRPQLEWVLEQVSLTRTGGGRPRTRPDHVLADKAYRLASPGCTTLPSLDKAAVRTAAGHAGGDSKAIYGTPFRCLVVNAPAGRL